jgi:hypothetical protein
MRFFAYCRLGAPAGLLWAVVSCACSSSEPASPVSDGQAFDRPNAGDAQNTGSKPESPDTGSIDASAPLASDGAVRADVALEAADARRSDASAPLASDGAVRADAALNATDGGFPASTWLSGAACQGILDDSFGKWRGRTTEIAGTWCDDTADNQANCPSIGPGEEYGSWKLPLDVAVGGLDLSGGSTENWKDAANGAYEDRWRKTLNKLKSSRSGKGTTYIRFAHEFNGDWYWPVTESRTADFKNAWIRFYNLKQEIFPEGKLAWSPNDDTTINLDVRNAYPGSEYVDVIAVDSYNQDPAAGTAAEFAQKINAVNSNGSPKGLEAWRKFAESKGRPMAISEWSGVADRGDFPDYMTELHKWLVTHGGSGPGQVEYEILFNCPWSNNTFALYPTSAQPNAAARYAQEW